jgi:hypothetical protein
VRRWASRREIVRRLEAVETQLAQQTPAPLAGQQTINVGHIRHHAYEGPGPCKAEDFGHHCGAHRDEHQHAGNDSP